MKNRIWMMKMMIKTVYQALAQIIKGLMLLVQLCACAILTKAQDMRVCPLSAKVSAEGKNGARCEIACKSSAMNENIWLHYSGFMRLKPLIIFARSGVW
jgi:hypothetical protein